MNPVELGQGTFPLSEAATDRFAIMINIGYLPPEEEAKLVHFDFKHVRLNALMTKERIIQLRSAINDQVYLHDRLATYIQRLVAATRPYNPETTGTRIRRQSWSNTAWTSALRRARSSAGAVSQRCGRCSSGAGPRSTRRTSRISPPTCCRTGSGSGRTPPAMD